MNLFISALILTMVSFAALGQENSPCVGSLAKNMQDADSRGWRTKEVLDVKLKDILNDRVNAEPPADHERFEHIYIAEFKSGEVAVIVAHDNDCYVGSLVFATHEEFQKWFDGGTAS